MKEKNKQLAGRLILFSDDVLGFCRLNFRDYMVRSLLLQVVRSATSVGANYFEANKASSFKDFRNKMYLCLKELNETKYWLIVLGRAGVGSREALIVIYRECLELNAIFQSIVNKIKTK